MGTDSNVQRKAHISYLLRNLNALPAAYAQNESNSLTLAYFLVSSLALLNALDEVRRDDVIDWVYALQVLPRGAAGQGPGHDTVRTLNGGCQLAEAVEAAHPSPSHVGEGRDNHSPCHGGEGTCCSPRRPCGELHTGSQPAASSACDGGKYGANQRGACRSSEEGRMALLHGTYSQAEVAVPEKGLQGSDSGGEGASVGVQVHGCVASSAVDTEGGQRLCAPLAGSCTSSTGDRREGLGRDDSAAEDGSAAEARAWAFCVPAARSLGGFRGSLSMVGTPFSPTGAPSAHGGDLPHLANSYTALALLTLLGDDLARVDRPGMARLLRALQHLDGSFSAVPCGGERDLRFVFCAAAICTLLGSWEGVDRERAYAFICSAQSYDGAFGLSPGLESHGGSTYCAVASLALMGRLHGADAPSSNAPWPGARDMTATSALVRWCLMRQAGDGGLQGRINKPADSCYAFWLGASLSLLGAQQFVATDELRGFLLSCQNEKYGGFSKLPYGLPDLLHTFYSLCGLSLLGKDGLCLLDCKLGVPLVGKT